MDHGQIEQTPACGTHRALCCGDCLEFRLRRPGASGGTAWLRTNLGSARETRTAIVNSVEKQEPRLARDWRDWPMKPTAPDSFSVTIPLAEVGHFEAKAFYLAHPKATPEWPPGDNVSLNVAPAHTVGANGIYNAFVRQFGARKPSRAMRQRNYGGVVDARRGTVLAPSGTFRDLIERLDFIIDRLGCRYLLLLPIHPVPAVYGRMGLYGSPYAATDFFAVEPALARFDRAATPMDQFLELVDAVHARQARLMLDIAINHCGWSATIHALHPEWTVRDRDGTLRSPGAWGVTWQDLTELDFDNRELWRFMADVFLCWCRRGVDGFRCDAGYMIPFPAWEYIVAKVRAQYPETLFLLEGLGGKVSVTRRLLQAANLNWAYSELFQQYSRSQVDNYLPLAAEIGKREGVLVNFAETHDNQRLAASSPAESRLRTAMAALFSTQGAFAFANGVEWFATEKIDVHGNSDLNWGATPNQVNAIARLNRLLKMHPAFYAGTPVKWVHHQAGTALALLRGNKNQPHRLLILANLDTAAPVTAAWKYEPTGIGAGQSLDLLDMRPVELHQNADRIECRLEPGAVLCLPGDAGSSVACLEKTSPPEGDDSEPDRVRLQRAVAKVLLIRTALQGLDNAATGNVAAMAQALLDDPVSAIAELAGDREDLVVRWQWPRDRRRIVLAPPGHLLLITAPAPFRAELLAGRITLAAEPSMASGNEGHFAVLMPPPLEPWSARPDDSECTLLMRIFEARTTTQGRGTIRLLPPVETLTVPRVFSSRHLPATGVIVLRTNGRGAMMRAGSAGRDVYSRYDALLAANFHPEYPVDRHVMLTRLRAWVEFRGYSQALDRSCLTAVDCRDPHSVRWSFRAPFTPPLDWELDLNLTMAPGHNAIRVTAQLQGRTDSNTRPDIPEANIDLVLRPDIEDRNFHDDTLAYAGPERDWPAAVETREDGFIFKPPSRQRLTMTSDSGTFTIEHQWSYQVPHPVEAQRGMRPAADLFSPGYFRIPLGGMQPVHLEAAASGPLPDEQDPPTWPATTDVKARQSAPAAPQGAAALENLLADSLEAYVVRRGKNKTVIAGYPWFIDWGRDTLIVARGLLAAGKYSEVEAILRQFASFEDRGTLPNMIRGHDARDRDTSDAPLWFVALCADLMRHGDRRLLTESPAGERSLLKVAQNIVKAYRTGTANGIKVDPDSGLVFSPTHFTWMDTNYPAATPRQGYPVEIQALWYAALRFLETMTAEPQWAREAAQVRESILKYFFLPQYGFFADCLHARPGQAAAQALADDALRPNQLFVLTMEAVADPHRIGRRVLAACQELVVPGALRSLADRPVTHPLPVVHQDRLLNDPLNPYWGRYEGDEDTRRKPAYHNGAAWCWLYPVYVEAWWKTFGPSSRDTALAMLGAVVPMLSRGCLLQLPEICDGNAPHEQRGCDAQAWSVSECYRVLKMARAGNKP